MRHTFTFFLPFILCNYANCFKNNNKINLSVDFIVLKKINLVSAVICWKNEEMLSFSKKLNSLNVQLATYNFQNHYYKPSTVLTMNYYKIGIILDGECKEIDKFLIECALNNMFNESYFWLIHDSNKHVLPVLKALDFGINADITLVQQINDSFWVFDVYNPGFEQGGSLNATNIGFWTLKTGFIISMKDSKLDNRVNFHGLHLNVGIVITRHIKTPLLEYISKENRFEDDKTSRYLYSLLEYFPQKFNYTTQIKRTLSWGYVRQGKFNGIVSMLARKQIDYSATALQMRIERYPYVSYLYNAWNLDCAFLFRHPKRTNNGFDVFLRPMEDSCWYAVLSAIILIVILMKIVLNLAKFIHIQERESSWSYLTLFSFYALIQQDVPRIQNIFSGRLLVLTLLIFTTIVYQFYSTSIIRALLMESPKTITNIKALYESNLMVGAEDIAYTRDWFENAKDTYHAGIYEEKIKATDKQPEQYFPMEEGIEKAKKGGFAYHLEKVNAYRIIQDTWSQNEICDLTEVPFVDAAELMFVVRKYSPFKEIFTKMMVLMHERGLTSHQFQRWTTLKPQCKRDNGATIISVEFLEMSSAFVLLTLGIIAGVLILIVEKLNFYLQQRQHIPFAH